MRNALILLFSLCAVLLLPAAERPHIVLVMADDMGWGQTGYYRHPVLKTPHLDAMAANGIRFDRFYAGGPVCSPTRATVLTGRTHDRTGVQSHGYPLRLQEKTVAQALRKAGYATGHFGKWHLNGLRGPGVPILGKDTHSPGAFGFERWLSVTNFFDLHPILSREGTFEEFEGDSSEIVVEEALKFISAQAEANKPSFTVIWYGTPHSPWMALPEDEEAFAELDEKSRRHYAELVAMDRSIGTLRAGLRKNGIAGNTLVWFCSDNGGLPGIAPDTVGGLRGFKGSLHEGGLRVPAVIEWPSGIERPRTTGFPAGAMDIFPTLAEIAGLPVESMLQPQDGMSLVSLLKGEEGRRATPLGFRSNGRLALIDNDYKLISSGKGKGKGDGFALYNLKDDPVEERNLLAEDPERARALEKRLLAWNKSVDRSVAGGDYPEGTVDSPQPKRQFWTEVEEYRPYFKQWSSRPEYQSRLRKK